MNKTKKSGYILLISALVISAVLLLCVSGVAAGGYYVNAGVSDAASRQQSFFLAWSCLQMARLRIAENLGTPETGSVPVGGNTCDILAVNMNVPMSGQITIQSRAITKSAAANLQMVVDSGDLTLISWKDLDSS